jgi:hypothetical protein
MRQSLRMLGEIDAESPVPASCGGPELIKNDEE